MRRETRDSVPVLRSWAGSRPATGSVPRMIETGQTAPDFTLPDQDGEDVTLSSLRGGPVVVYFYPKADALIY